MILSEILLTNLTWYNKPQIYHKCGLPLKLSQLTAHYSFYAMSYQIKQKVHCQRSLDKKC